MHVEGDAKRLKRALIVQPSLFLSFLVLQCLLYFFGSLSSHWGIQNWRVARPAAQKTALLASGGDKRAPVSPQRSLLPLKRL